jgi:hypothetical protein
MFHVSDSHFSCVRCFISEVNFMLFHKYFYFTYPSSSEEQEIFILYEINNEEFQTHICPFQVRLENYVAHIIK